MFFFLINYSFFPEFTDNIANYLLTSLTTPALTIHISRESARLTKQQIAALLYDVAKKNEITMHSEN